MPTTAASTPLHQQRADTLHQRQAELRALLQAAAGLGISGDNTAEVVDFKDVAAEETRALVDEVTLAHAADELAQVTAALGRIGDGTYGWCEDCAEAIDERRLLALPATRFCTACQTMRERRTASRR